MAKPTLAVAVGVLRFEDFDGGIHSPSASDTRLQAFRASTILAAANPAADVAPAGPAKARASAAAAPLVSRRRLWLWLVSVKQ